MTDELGITICATHISFDRIKEDTQDVIRQHKLWNCKYVGVGAMPSPYSTSKEGYVSFAREASEYARILHDNGLQFIYHNHSFEYQKFDGITGMEILLQESDPEVFGFELDTYWVQHGGADPIEWIYKVSGRMDVVHFKDMAVQVRDGRVQIMTEVGEGNSTEGYFTKPALKQVKWLWLNRISVSVIRLKAWLSAEETERNGSVDLRFIVQKKVSSTLQLMELLK